MGEEIKVVNIEEQEVEETKQNIKDDKQVKTTVFTLGEIILKLKMPEKFSPNIIFTAGSSGLKFLEKNLEDSKNINNS